MIEPSPTQRATRAELRPFFVVLNRALKMLTAWLDAWLAAN